MRKIDEPVESGTEYIESPENLKIDLDKIDIVDIENVTVEKKESVNVHDLEVDNLHNYQVKGLGLVHNGGGII